MRAGGGESGEEEVCLGEDRDNEEESRGWGEPAGRRLDHGRRSGGRPETGYIDGVRQEDADDGGRSRKMICCGDP